MLCVLPWYCWISAVFRTFHNLYFDAVCKLHIFCIRMNIICGSEGRLLALGGELKSMQLPVCVTVTHVGQSALPLPNSGLQL